VVTRALDLAVLLLLAVAILMPRPDVKVKPGLTLAQDQRDRVAELQTRMVADPTDGVAAMELADLFLDARRPDWALATVSAATEASPNDHRLHLRRSLALADHYEAARAHVAAERALALCEGGSVASCGEAEHSRLTLLESTLRRVKGIDMRKDPNRAKEELIKAFRPAFIPRARKNPARDAGG